MITLENTTEQTPVVALPGDNVYKKYTNEQLLRALCHCCADDGTAIEDNLNYGTVVIRHDGIDNVIKIVLELISRAPFEVNNLLFCEYFYFTQADFNFRKTSCGQTPYGIRHGIYYAPAWHKPCDIKYVVNSAGTPTGDILGEILLNNGLYRITNTFDDMSDFDSVVENARHLSAADYDDSYCRLIRRVNKSLFSRRGGDPNVSFVLLS